MSFTRRIGTSIAAKLLVVIAGMSLVLTLLISSAELWQEARITIQNEQSEAHAVVMANVDTLALTLWDYDRSTMEITARSLTRGTSIFRVAIQEDGSNLFLYARPGALPKADRSWAVPLLRPNTGQKLGTLTLWESYEGMQATLKQRALSLIVAELVKVLITSALLFVVAYLLIAWPLRRVAREVRRVEEAGEDSQISVRRVWGHDEIDALVDAINASNQARRHMAAQQRKNELREANAGKLKALGQLAGGIAHDFNNILGAILGFAVLLDEDLAQDKEKQRFTHRIISAARRGRDFVSQIWTFAHAEKPEQAVVDLAQVVRQSLVLLKEMLPSDIGVDASLGEQQLPILADSTLVGQMVTNLCLNAGEAFGGRAGTISVRLARAPSGEVERLLAAPVGAGERLVGELASPTDAVFLRVSDSAGHIPQDTLDRIFEPFFSTKDRRVGAGLGLAVVHSVIVSHGAVCHVASRDGEGTTFTVYFPLSKLLLGEIRPVSDDRPYQGCEGILIVDDEQDIVDSLSLGLERLGYQVVGIDDPMVALAAFEADPVPWDVLVTDEMMPGMHGLELISRIREIKPGIKTVLCTGYSKELQNGVDSAKGVDVFLLKPVTARDVARQIRTLFQFNPGL